MTADNGSSGGVWSAIPGQGDVVARLSAAVASPMHAYLFVGPRGSGKRPAAAVFAGELLAAADPRSGRDPERLQRHRRLAVAEQHPDIFVVDPAGNRLRRAGEAAALVAEASRTPAEGARKVLVVNRFHTATPAAAASLLKPVEEPSASTVWLLLAEQVPPEHVTIESRCIRVNFRRLSSRDISAALMAEGLASPETAQGVATAAGGNLERARMLASDENVSARRQAWWSIPDRLDGTGAVVAVIVTEIRALITAAAGPLAAQHRDELVALADQEEMFGTRGSGRAHVEARQRRELRQLRTDELHFGLVTLAGRYRDLALRGLGAQPDEADSAGPDPALLDALDRIRAMSTALTRNPNEALALQALLLGLPSVKPL